MNVGIRNPTKTSSYPLKYIVSSSKGGNKDKDSPGSYMKLNYQDWLKYGVFFFLVGYALFIVVGLFGLPPNTLHNAFSFLTGILDYFRLDYTSIGKAPQSDSEVEEGKGIQVYRR